ncbi:DNA polymerase IV [Gracilibacillus sp. YIM 98692]|uniref:DNA polymerase IV n=1 Tax=Gracilibacillus sp. YIM 98692 TaxID=2663532 RepID=UPI0013D298D1|nr:DNA polymerase IV [Gracilibacillus sp. YIM 98692]
MNKWYPKNGRVILHVDMNSFYASVEIADNPDLRGKPVAIAGNPDERKGIIVTSSYEARKYGVKTTMTLWEAKKLCPHLIVKRPNFHRYRAVSSQIFQLLEEFTPYVEPVSIDEAYLDITLCHQLGTPIQLAEWIQAKLKKELHLPCSIGVAPNKFLAKMASDMKKPNGITILRKRDVAEKLWPLDIEEMYGIGKKTAEKLKRCNIFKINDLVEAEPIILKKLLGVNGEKLQARAKGNDPRAVDPERAQTFKSVGNSKTFPHDISDYEQLLSKLKDLANGVSIRLQRKKAVGDTLQLVIRYHDRTTITRRLKLSTYTDDQTVIYGHIVTLFDQHWNGDAIRLLGITVLEAIKKQEATYQLDLFQYKKELEKGSSES